MRGGLPKFFKRGVLFQSAALFDSSSVGGCHDRGILRCSNKQLHKKNPTFAHPHLLAGLKNSHILPRQPGDVYRLPPPLAFGRVARHRRRKTTSTLRQGAGTIPTCCTPTPSKFPTRSRTRGAVCAPAHGSFSPVISRGNDDFWQLYYGLPADARAKARQPYQFHRDPDHPSLRFKKPQGPGNLWSIRFGGDHRAVCAAPATAWCGSGWGPDSHSGRISERHRHYPLPP